MLKLSGKMMELLDIVGRGGVWSSDEIGKELGKDKAAVRRIVKTLRKKFNEGDKNVDRYIYTTSGGYTIDQKPEHPMYESRMRIQLGAGVIANGIYVFKQAKRLAPAEFRQLLVEYKPKMLTMNKFIR